MQKSDTFNFSSVNHFSYLWKNAKKSVIQIFDTLIINKFLRNTTAPKDERALLGWDRFTLCLVCCVTGCNYSSVRSSSVERKAVIDTGTSCHHMLLITCPHTCLKSSWWEWKAMSPDPFIHFNFWGGLEGKPKIKICGEGSVTKIKYVGRGFPQR